jgi:glycosyltransferase involved in cell wall biosynthesis
MGYQYLMAKLCLNMIVKNEADKIVRCLESVAPYIDCYAIVDTGSTDETKKTIETFFAAKSIPGKITDVRFVNFEQARNAGLKAARSLSTPFDYIFLLDADMVLEVEDKQFRDKLTDVAYDVIQKAGGLSYFNRRLVRRDQTGEYIGVTHEYLNVPGGSLLHGIFFTDHADGANRKDKFKRDIKLLRAAIKKEPTNSRYVYYLAQSYRDSGLWELAASAYLRRAEAGGWDEEAWSARFNYAHCLNALGDKAGFIRELLTAYNQRPSRAETLYDLAKHYREAGQQATSLLYSDAGMKIPYTTDMLFVSDQVYHTGLREEYSICAFYHPAHRQHGYSVCSELAIDPQCTEWSRELARGNLFHYIQPLKELCHSFEPKQLEFVPKDGYIPMNPSIITTDGRLTCILRSVNYTMDEVGRYLIKGTNGEANGTNPIHTRNYLLRLDDALQVKVSYEILPPVDFPPPKYNLVVGFEDMRLFERSGEWWTISNLREQNPEGWCEQHLAKITIVDEQDGPRVRLSEILPILPTPQQHEKNWMPWVDGDKLAFVYKLGQNINETGAVWHGPPVPFAVDRLSGGSQVIPFKGGWLALVHESRTRPGDGKRYYQHRFVWWDAAKILRQISIAFVLHDRQIEFAAGLCWHPDGKRLVVSYGIKDCEAWLATIDWHDVSELLAGL